MELGKFDLDGDSDIISERRFYRHDSDRKRDSYYHDLPRLLLLLAMLLCAIAGGIYNSYKNKPEKILLRSMKETLAEPFRASLEGSTSLKRIQLAYYRSRQRYSPGNGLNVEMERNSDDKETLPFDALTALQALEKAVDIREYDREDMYGHGTRHFYGVLDFPGTGESVVHAFEYWMDFRSYKAVRLVITRVRRNVAVDDHGNSVSKETYINIWFTE